MFVGAGVCFLTKLLSAAPRGAGGFGAYRDGRVAAWLRLTPWVGPASLRASAQDFVQALGGQDALGPAQQGVGVGGVDLRTHGLARRAEFQLNLAKEDQGFALLPTLFVALFMALSMALRVALFATQALDAGDVRHFGLLLKGNQFVHELSLQRLG